MASSETFTSPVQDQTPVIEFLTAASSYDVAEPVQRHETHGAIVFLAGDKAYKLKRAVRFPYMDYSTADQRRDMCERELAVNRRTAPSLYIGVRSVLRGPAGNLTFAPKDAEDALDWVVVMRRFDQASLLEELRKQSKITPQIINALAETVAAFHHAAEVIHHLGGSKGIAGVVGGDARMLKTMAGQPFKAEKLDRLARLAWMTLDHHGAFLDQRRREGFVRRCHGDLHLNNICLIHGLPVLFDAIEFNDEFSCIDTFYDLAFLLMDLDRHGLRNHANALLNRYLEMTGDYGGLPALPLFLSCRAAVRSHVLMSGMHASRRHDQDDTAQALLDRAINYLNPVTPRLVAIGGLSGTGKSTLARHLAPALGIAPGAVVLRSDVIRKRLLRVSDTERLPDSAYTPEINDRVFDRLADIAGKGLAAGHSVVADAVYGKESHRQQIAAVAAHAGVPFDGFWLTAAQPLLEERIAGRQGDPSDATADVLHQQLEHVHEPASWVPIDASTAPDIVAAAASARLHPGQL